MVDVVRILELAGVTIVRNDLLLDCAAVASLRTAG